MHIYLQIYTNVRLWSWYTWPTTRHICPTFINKEKRQLYEVRRMSCYLIEWNQKHTKWYIKMCTHILGGLLRRYTLYNRYHSRKWNQQPDFIFWMRLFAFHFTRIPMEKAWTHLFSQASYEKIVRQIRFFNNV